MTDNSTDTNNSRKSMADSDYHIDRILSGEQNLFGSEYNADREEFCKIHLGNRKLDNEHFLICDLLRVAYDYTNDPKLKKLILRITSQASAMQVKLKEYKRTDSLT